jgi:catechol 2,3-dioxygenase-like lactoylglutathione lyase family enzyme
LKIEHIALASNSERESDKFFIDLFGLEKVRNFMVSNDKMKKFFNVDAAHNFIRYGKEEVSVEVIVTNKKEQAKDSFTHSCIVVEDGLKLLEKAETMGYKTIKVSREKDSGYYLFLKDNFGNLFEIKES